MSHLSYDMTTGEVVRSAEIPAPVMPRAEIDALISAGVEELIERTALSRGYSSAATLCSYTSSGIAAWKAEADAFVAWRDAVWTEVFARQTDASLTVDQILSKIPAITWPPK